MMLYAYMIYVCIFINIIIYNYIYISTTAGFFDHSYHGDRDINHKRR